MTDPCEGKYDIVSRLRDHTNRDDNDIAEAAAYIERLRAKRDALFVLTDRFTAEHDALRAERDEVRQSYCSLMEAYRGGNGRVTANKLGWGYLFERADQTTTPHTRRLAMLSNTCAMTLAQKSDRILAQTRGLSGATPNATQLIEELRWALEENRREVERLTTERDEARRMWCELMAANTAAHREQVANHHGWDCFKENTDD